ncbi:magnesium transporter [Pseudoleptotrichia goodfellowii]|uniref:Magnesium transporter MgtE n=2 Tax=Pseudoleptotrichia goodfellowii TaxID=157692 RepID=D0GJX0_9FUSO|nr:magnesium transporter [Pseudoleptotrichia goodfellowii]EEY35633.1 magnesium transporter [Pseudoleptotrichia goodfellowii F0264]MBF4805691.1 magnesium transporter [Pseudoleptotrichia goodfellowii]BBM36497.1 magnesium transporter [Pseudoleptotrichia goodfellowii]
MENSIQNLIKEKKYFEIRKYLNDLNTVEVSELLNQFESSELIMIFRLLSKDRAADVFSYLDTEHQEMIINTMTDVETKNIFDELYFDDIVDIIEEMPSNVVKKILKNTDTKDRHMINQLLKYPDNSAGSIMTTEYVDLKKDMKVSDAIREIRNTVEDKENIYTCYVISADRKLEGVVSLKEIITSDNDVIIEDIMNRNFVSVHTNDDQEEVAEIIKKYDLIVLPVVDIENRLLGIITIDDVMDVIDKEATEDFHKMAGISPVEESYLKTSAFTMARQRIMWLIVLMISATFTGRIIGKYENVLQSVVILASFIPMLMDTGGNAGAQSSTIVVRALALGEVDVKDTFRVLIKEFSISFIVAIVLAAINYLRLIALTKVPLNVALTVSVTLIFVVIISKIIGALLPIGAKVLKMDPAIMAGPLITTILDALTLTIYFKFATVFLKI